VEFGRLDDRRRAELEGNEVDPFDAAGNELRWRSKDRHVALRDPDGRLVASAGLVVADVQVAQGALFPVVGIGGVIVAAPHRGKGLANRVIVEALRRAATLGPSIAMLFCHRDRAGLYLRHQFVEISPPVFVEQPGGLVEMPMVAMWRAIRAGAELPSGRVIVRSLPF
jgi:predicted GNAT family N-acyltransferase